MMTKIERRHFLGGVVAVGSGTALVGLSNLVMADEKKKEEEVSAAEDLMREHGALNRILLVYDDAIQRLGSHGQPDYKALNQSAKIIHNFIENYHEKLEEEFVFPRLATNRKYSELVKTLKTQHEAGRKLTEVILDVTKSEVKKSDSERLKSNLASFVRMYRPHEAFEDTIVFPAFKESLSKKEYDGLGEMFEEREHKQLGKEGFEGVLDQITEIEKKLGLHDIAKFTPN